MGPPDLGASTGSFWLMVLVGLIAIVAVIMMLIATLSRASMPHPAWLKGSWNEDEDGAGGTMISPRVWSSREFVSGRPQGGWSSKVGGGGSPPSRIFPSMGRSPMRAYNPGSSPHPGYQGYDQVPNNAGYDYEYEYGL